MADDLNELLKRSCDRLPKLVELDAPVSIIIVEFSLMSKLAIEVIQDMMRQSTRRESERWRKYKTTKAAALDIMDSNGRHNPEGNSTMLWDQDWERLRAILLEAAEAAGEGE